MYALKATAKVGNNVGGTAARSLSAKTSF